MRKGVQLLYPFEEARLKKWNSSLYLQEPKLDGVRMRAILDPNKIILLSSEENIMNFALPHIVEELEHIVKQLNNLGIYELDGEAYYHGWNFETINSIASRTTNIHPDSAKLQYHIFDHIIPKATNFMRRIDLHKASTLFSSPLHLVPCFQVETLSEIMANYTSFIKRGYEGMVVRHPVAAYVRKRTTYAMKFKPKKQDTYTIIGVNEEISKDGIPKDRLGSILCTSDEGTEFSVSAGLNDEKRERYWAMRDQLIGKKVIVHYQAITAYGTPKFAFNLEVLDETN